MSEWPPTRLRLEKVSASARVAAADPLVRNSLFLMAATGLVALSGFLFWVTVARLYPASEVGRATTLISAVTLLSYFSLFGLNTSLVRHLPRSRQRASHVGTAFTTGFLLSAALAISFVAVVPLVAPQLGFVRDTPAAAALFVALAMCAGLNLLTDSVFIALRQAKYNLLINGLLQGAVKLSLPMVLTSAGAYGIFAASGAGFAVAAIASVVVIQARLGLRVRPGISGRLLRQTIGYSMGSYAESCLNLVPLLIIPFLTLHVLGPVQAAAYFVAFQISHLINAISFAIGESLFAEGAHREEDLPILMRRSAYVMAALVVPAAVVVAVAAYPILHIFGAQYAREAQGTLVVLALSSLAVAFNTWSGFLLKVTRQLVALTTANAVYALVTTLAAWVAVSHDAVWVAVAWGAGNFVCGLIGSIALFRGRVLGRAPTRHVFSHNSAARSSAPSSASVADAEPLE